MVVIKEDNITGNYDNITGNNTVILALIPVPTIILQVITGNDCQLVLVIIL